MGFAQEMKDFAAGLKATTEARDSGVRRKSALNQIERTRKYQDSDGGINPFGGGGAGVPVHEGGGSGGGSDDGGGAASDFSGLHDADMPNAGGGSFLNQAYTYYKSRGLTDAHAAAIAGNLQMESGGLPEVFSGRRMGDNGTAGYAAQWRGSRLNNLMAFAKSRGEERPSLKTQLDFVLEEGNPDSPYAEAGAVKAHRLAAATNDVGQATTAFMEHYERPNADPKINGINKRIQFASSLSGGGTPEAGGSAVATTNPAGQQPSQGAGVIADDTEADPFENDDTSGDDDNEDTAMASPQAGIPLPQIASMQELQGGDMSPPVIPEWDQNSVFAAEGGKLPSTDEINTMAGRAYTQAPAAAPSSGFVARRVGQAKAGTSVPAITSSQQAFRDMRAQQAVPAAPAAPTQSTYAQQLLDWEKANPMVSAPGFGRPGFQGSALIPRRNAAPMPKPDPNNANDVLLARQYSDMFRQSMQPPPRQVGSHFAEGGVVPEPEEMYARGGRVQRGSSRAEDANYGGRFDEFFTERKPVARRAKAAEHRGSGGRGGAQRRGGDRHVEKHKSSNDPKDQVGVPTPTPRPDNGPAGRNRPSDYAPDKPVPTPTPRPDDGVIPAAGTPTSGYDPAVGPFPARPEGTAAGMPGARVPAAGTPTEGYDPAPASTFPARPESPGPNTVPYRGSKEFPERPGVVSTNPITAARMQEYDPYLQNTPNITTDVNPGATRGATPDGVIPDPYVEPVDMDAVRAADPYLVTAPNVGMGGNDGRTGGREGEVIVEGDRAYIRGPDGVMRPYEPDQSRFGYARGGVVPDEDEVRQRGSQRAESAAYSSSSAAPQQSGAADGGAGSSAPDVAGGEDRKPSLQPTPRLREGVNQALQGGLRFIQQHFFGGGDQQGALPEQDPAMAHDRGIRRFAAGEGAATPDEIRGIDDGIDPDRQLSEGDRQMVRLAKSVDWYNQQGRGKEAGAAAASLLQYGAQRFQRLGTLAGAAYRQYLKTNDPKDFENTTRYLEAAYQMIPDGGSFDIQQENGKLIAVHQNADGKEEEIEVTPEMLPDLVKGTMSGSAYWQHIRQLGDPKGYQADLNNRNAQLREGRANSEWDRREGVKQGEARGKEGRQAEEWDRRHGITSQEGIDKENRQADRDLQKEQRSGIENDRRAIRNERWRIAREKNKQVDWGTVMPLVEQYQKAVEADDKDAINAAGSRLFDALPQQGRAKIMQDLEIPISSFQYAAGSTPPQGVPPDAKKAKDGNWYTPDPNRPGKYIRWP